MAAHSTGIARCRLAVDLGAARTRIAVRDEGLIVDAPSVLALDTRTGDIVAAGEAAAAMRGRGAPHVRVVHPLENGIVADPDQVGVLLRHLAGRRPRFFGRWRRALVALPCGSGPAGRRTAAAALAPLGVRHVESIPAPLAAAVGAGIPYHQAEASLSVVCGASATQAAIIADGTVVDHDIVAVGGDAVERAITEHLRAAYGVVLPRRETPSLFARLGPGTCELGYVPLRCWDLRSASLRTIDVDLDTLRAAVDRPVGMVVDAVRRVLGRCTPELVIELADRGIVMAGGLAALPGMDTMVRDAAGVPVHVAPDPANAVVRGLSHLLDTRARPEPHDRGALPQAPESRELAYD